MTTVIGATHAQTVLFYVWSTLSAVTSLLCSCQAASSVTSAAGLDSWQDCMVSLMH